MSARSLNFDYGKPVTGQLKRELATFHTTGLRGGKICRLLKLVNLGLRGITGAAHFLVSGMDISVLGVDSED